MILLYQKFYVKANAEMAPQNALRLVLRCRDRAAAIVLRF